MRLVGICGSLRAASCNHGLLRAAGAVLHKKHGIHLEIVPAAMIGALPLFNEDDEAAGTINSHVAAFRSKIAGADGFLLATPEYNSSVPAALKNAIDWASRGSNLFNSKACCIIGAGGYAGTTRAQAHLRDITTAVNCHTQTHPELRVEIAKEGAGGARPFDGKTGDVVDASVLQKIEWQMDGFLQYANMVRLAKLDQVRYRSG